MNSAMDTDEDAFLDTAENEEESQHTQITPEMERVRINDGCNCNYYTEYSDFLECFKECGGNPQVTIE